MIESAEENKCPTEKVYFLRRVGKSVSTLNDLETTLTPSLGKLSHPPGNPLATHLVSSHST